MARSPKRYSCPQCPGMASLSPLWPLRTLPAVLSRINAAIPQGAWLEGCADIALNARTHRLELVLADGVRVDLQRPLLEERCLPADTVLAVTSAQLSRLGRQRTAPPPARTAHPTECATQTDEDPLGDSHPSLIFPFIDEMIQALVQAQKTALQAKK